MQEESNSSHNRCAALGMPLSRGNRRLSSANLGLKEMMAGPGRFFLGDRKLHEKTLGVTLVGSIWQVGRIVYGYGLCVGVIY